MSVELGKYAVVVLASYGASLGMIVALVGASLLRARWVKTQLEKVEKRRSENG